MGYFAVVLARHDDGWDANDIDLDAIDDLGDLADAMRDSSSLTDGDATWLLFLEREDAWFAVVRVDGEDDPRVFISDNEAIEHSAYAEMLLEAAGGSRAGLVAIPDLDDEVEESDVEEDEDEEPEAIDSGPIGDHDLLADLGTDGETLVALCEKEGLLPSEILTTLADNAGAAEVLEAVR